MAKVKRGFLTYDTRRDRLSVSWRETLSLVADELLLRQMMEVRNRARGRLLDLGCGAKPYSLLFSPLVEEYVGVDLPSTLHGRNQVDVYGNAMALPFKSGSFDTVLCTEVLEHVPEPKAVLNEAWRVLKTGGSLLLSAPQSYWVHEAPNDLYRFTEYGLAYLLKTSGFEVSSITPMSGVPAYLVDSASKVCVLLAGGLNTVLGRLLRRSDVNLLSHSLTRLLIALPQWTFLACYFGARGLARGRGRLALVTRLLDCGSGRFTLGHVVVAVKR